jgi:uncharacterized protein YecT (DUF1311 family)
MTLQRDGWKDVRFVILLAAAAILPTAPARADECTNAMTQQAMTQCAALKYKKADAALNDLYRQVRQRLTDDAVHTQRLVDAQKAWLAFRDAECKFESRSGEPGAGSVAEMALADCLTALTAKRSADFRELLSCPEGDVECALPPR